MDVTIPRSPVITRGREQNIPATSTKVVDTLPLSNFKTLKYFVIFFNSTNDITKEMEVTVKKSGSTVDSVVGNRVGVGMDLEVNPDVSGLNFEMNVVNNESFNIDMSFARMTI